MTIEELIEKRGDLWDKAKKFLDTHTADDGTISAKDAATFEKMEADINVLSEQIKRTERRTAMDNYLATPAAAPILNQPNAKPFDNHSRTDRRGVVGNEYHRNFINAFRRGFGTPEVMNSLREGTLEDGGILLPTEFDEQLVSRLTEENVLREIGRVITTASTHQINIVATEPAASWIGEGDEINLNSPKFAKKDLKAYKLAIGSRISNELLYDVFYSLEIELQNVLNFSKNIY